MTPDEYREAAGLFERLRELPEGQRAVVLDQACSERPDLHQQVCRLLEADREAAGESFLDRRAIEDAAELLAPQLSNLASTGTQLGNYRLGPRIGAGGMGVVYEGQDLRLKRRVAIKILPPPLGEDQTERVKRFQREARAASLLNHPNIVSIFDADFDRGSYYIATEFIEGKTLRQLLASEPQGLDSHTILDVITQIASALKAAHDAGIVHRDIKPENIMLRPDGFVKVLDFGLAKLQESPRGPSGNDANNVSELRTRPGHLAGTIQYLSPEQVAGKPVDARSDLFSLGVVAYELATGARPFDGPTDGAVFNATLNCIPSLPSALRPSIGPELDLLIMRALEKDPDLRFQSAGDLRDACRRVSHDKIVRAHEKASGSSHNSPVIADRSPGIRRSRLVVALAGLLAVCGAGFFWLTRPPQPPRVKGLVQITGDGQEKSFFVTDGTRIYYGAGKRDSHAQVLQISVNGGEPVPMPRLAGMIPLDISPNRSEILLGQYVDGASDFPIWAADILGSAPRRIGDLVASEARWSPKGDEILYSIGPELRLAHSDGSDSRVLAKANGIIQRQAWSPDGRVIRFTVSNSKTLWEVTSEGGGQHMILPEWTDYQQEGGTWTPDGMYYVFDSKQIENRSDLWALRRDSRLLKTGALSPVRLSSGPMNAYYPEASPDGRKVFFVGALKSAELVRYETKSEQWVPYLGGVSAMQLDYSRDGKWVTYARSSDLTIWRSAVDGSDKLQLTAPPLLARNPRWSPDGTQITFYGARRGKPDRVYVVPAAGGVVRQLTNGEAGHSGDEDGNWSADGRSLLFGPTYGDQLLNPGGLPLKIIDIKTQHISDLRGSERLWSPRWSPDGRYIAAMGTPNKLWLYDLETGARTPLTTTAVGYPSWSRDSQYIYFKDSPSTTWFRMRIKDRKLERLASLKGLKTPGASLGWVGLAPDGSLISTRDTGSTEIYALEWDAP